MGRVFVVTGVTGFLGKVVLAELLRRREELELDRVLLLIRPKGPFGAEERFRREVQPSACFGRLPGDWREAVEVVSASLDRPGLGMEPAAHQALTRRATHIIHAAASVDFGLPL
ncbi:MAG TPA: SDR family oxidoreductase, partial [Gemmatimonadales bacterium]|nr:SDR family oxidoreductase [Gemmatimonadales bacterium]